MSRASGGLFVRYAERDVSGRDMTRRRLGVTALVVEEDVGAESLEEGPLVQSAEKQRLVDADVPGSQRAHDPLVRRGAARRHERGPDGRALGRIFRLNAMQRSEEAFEGSAGQGLLGGAHFARGEGLEPLPLVDAL